MSDPETLARLEQEVRDAETALDRLAREVIGADCAATAAAGRAMEAARVHVAARAARASLDAERADAYARYEAAIVAYDDAISAHRAAQVVSDD